MKVGNKRLTLVLIGVTLSLVMLRCGGGCGGCSCMETIPGGYQEPTEENAAQARLGSSAISFLEGNLKSIIASFMPEGLAFGIPESESDIALGMKAYVCSGNPCNDNVNPKCTGNPPMTPAADCCLCADLQGMDLTPVSPDKLDVRAYLDLGGRVKINIKTIWDNKCDVDLKVNDKPVTTSVVFRNDTPTKRMTFDVNDLVFEISDSDFDIKGGVLCSIANIGFIKGIIVDQMMKQFDIKSMIDDALKDMKCQPCPNGNECPVNAGATCDPADQACKVGGNCVPAPLGMEGRIDAASLLADFAPGLQAKLDLSIVTGGTNPEYVKSNGLTVRLLGGATSAQNMCVPQTTPPEPPGTGIPDLQFGAGTGDPLNKAFICAKCDPATPSCPTDSACDPSFKVCKKSDGTCPEVDFMAGIGVHEFFIQKVLWAAFNAGVLCINIGTSSIDMLNSGVLAALLPEIKALTEGKSKPVLLSLRPTQAPIVRLGAGTLKDDGSGKTVMVKPLLLVQINQLAIDFYVMAFDRYTRIFTLTADLELPVGLDLAPKDGEPGTLQIVPLLGDIGKGIKNTKVTNSEMLATPPETLEEAFGALIGSLLGPLLGGGLGGFDIPPICQTCDPAKPNCPAGTTCDASSEECTKSDGSCFQSIKLKIMAIRGEMPYAEPADCSDSDEAKPGCYQQFLSIYANLEMDTPNPPPPVETRAWIASVEVPSIEDLRRFGSDSRFIPRVTVAVPADSTSLEYSFRLNGGMWSPYARGPEFVISEPLMVLQGRHGLDVRARMVERPETTDVKGVRLDFIVDAEPPELKLERDERGAVTVKAEDLVTPAERIAMSYRSAGGDWVAIGNGEVLPADAVANGVDVRASDEVGRESLATITAPLAGAEGSASQGSAAGGGSAASGVSGIEADGCGCASVGTGSDSGLWAVLALIGAALWTLTRRR